MTNDPYYRRYIVIAGVAVGIVFIFIIRLFGLQIIDQSRREKAENNALVRQTVYPSRGLMYDRNGELLVFNQPVYEGMLIEREMGRAFDTISFCGALQITREEFEERMAQMKDTKNRGYSRYTPQVFMAQLQKKDVAVLEETLFNFPGVTIRKRTLRDYTYQAAAHVLGSVGEVNQQDLDRDDYYKAGDYAGRDGLEKQYETRLRGEKGVEVLLRDARGRIQGSYREGKWDKEAVAGEDLTLTIDIQLQLLAERLLQNKIGSVVAIEPKTGEILAMVSSPSWNPQSLVGRQRSGNYYALQQDPLKPLLNRATQAQYPPGSTFKTLQALAGLEEGTLKANTCYACNGPKSSPIKCTHNHKTPIDLEGALEQSCNPYFWYAFREMIQEHGYDHWRDIIMRFGITPPSGKYYDKVYGKGGWKAITVRSLSIGQGEILVTPMQLATQAACLANSGYFIEPHLVRDSATYAVHSTGIDTTYFGIVKRGMRRVMTAGTGRWYDVAELQFCGKTGTAQNPHGEDHAIFMGFAPLDDPQIAVAVVVENAGFGATWACPVAVLMMEQYLTGEATHNQWAYQRLVDANLIH